MRDSDAVPSMSVVYTLRMRDSELYLVGTLRMRDSDAVPSMYAAYERQ